MFTWLRKLRSLQVNVHLQVSERSKQYNPVVWTQLTGRRLASTSKTYLPNIGSAQKLCAIENLSFCSSHIEPEPARWREDYIPGSYEDLKEK